MTQNTYLVRRLTERQTAPVLEGMLGPDRKVSALLLAFTGRSAALDVLNGDGLPTLRARLL